MFIYVLCFSCFFFCSLLPCGHLLGMALLCDVCVFVTFPCGILGQVWYLIVLIPHLCHLSYFLQKLADQDFHCHGVFAVLL